MIVHRIVDVLGATGPVLSFALTAISIAIAIFGIYVSYSLGKNDARRKKQIRTASIILTGICLFFLFVSFVYAQYLRQNDVIKTRGQISDIKEDLYQNLLYDYYLLVDDNFDDQEITQNTRRQRNDLQSEIQKKYAQTDLIKCYSYSIEWKIVEIYQLDLKIYLKILDASLEYLKGEGYLNTAKSYADTALHQLQDAREKHAVLAGMRIKADNVQLKSYFDWAINTRLNELRCYLEAWGYALLLLCDDRHTTVQDFIDALQAISDDAYFDQYPLYENKIFMKMWGKYEKDLQNSAVAPHFRSDR